jgi:pimeloyl-ACP methyl ester carboxylesterase
VIRKLLALLFVPTFALAAEKGRFEGFVKISDKRELYVDWYQAKPGKPTVVLVNGLTYTTEQWNRFADSLVDRGVGVFRYDPMGMGQTLLKYAPVTEDIAIEDQVKDLHQLLRIFNLEESVNLVGLSYGGGLALIYAATYPKDIENLILMAPYTEPVAAQDQWIQSQIWYTRQVAPWNTASDDDLYAYFYRQIVYSTYPTAEPIVLENPYKLEAVYRMGLGIRKFCAEKIASKLPANTTHLLIAGRDRYIPRGVLDHFWDQVPDQAKSSRVVISNSDHKIPEEVPRFSAALVNEIIMNGNLFSRGRDFEADPSTGMVQHKNGRIKLPKER